MPWLNFYTERTAREYLSMAMPHRNYIADDFGSTVREGESDGEAEDRMEKWSCGAKAEGPFIELGKKKEQNKTKPNIYVLDWIYLISTYIILVHFINKFFSSKILKDA